MSRSGGDDVVGHAGNVIPADAGRCHRFDRGAVGGGVAAGGDPRPRGGVSPRRGGRHRQRQRLYVPMPGCCVISRGCSGRSPRRPTMWRSLNEIDGCGAGPARGRPQPGPRVRVGVDRGPARADPAEAAPATARAIKANVIRIDASLIDSHSDKERAAGNFQGRLGVSSAVGVLRQHRGTAGGHCAHQAARDRTRPSITSRSSTPRSPRSRRGGGATSWSPSTAPGPVTRWSST